MISGIDIVSVWVLDHDALKPFYIEKLDFVATTDLVLDGGVRWLTVRPEGSSSQEFVLMDRLHSMLDHKTAQQVRTLGATRVLSLRV